ncbi:acylphosphatase [Roseobacteraceae bacterium NS-SX3]
MTDIAMRARVTGRVQGVAFRAWTKSEAARHGLTGWVRNEPDGSVRAFMMGTPAGVAAMARALSEGPPAAQVTGVQTEKADPEPGLTGFRITG